MFVLLLLFALGTEGIAHAGDGQDDAVALRATIEAGHYERAEDLAGGYLARVRVNATAGEPAAVARAAGLYVDALILNGKGALPSTVALAEEALRLSKSQQARSQDERAPYLVILGRALTSAGQYREAIPVLTQAVTLAEKRSDDPSTLIGALDALGRALDRAGRYNDALAAHRRCAEVQERSHAAPRLRARTAQAIASALQGIGHYQEARTLLDRAVTLHAEAGAEHPAVIDTWVQLGNQLWFEGHLGEAEEALKRAVQLADSTLRANHPTTAWALRKLAATEIDLGNVSAARDLHERALSIVERSLPPEHFELAAYLNGLAECYMLTGDYPAARRYYERALLIARAQFGDRHDWVATFIHNLALVDSRLGDFAAARREHARAIAIWESVYGRTHQVVAVALVEMANAWSQEGSPATAIPMLERALAIRTARFGRNHRDVGRTLASLALALDRVGQTTRARQMAEQARTIFDRLPDPPAPDVAQVLTLSAERAARRGDYAAALRDYARARDIRVGLFGSEHPLVAETEVGLASATAATGDHAAAFAIASDAETTAREHLRLTLRYLPERESLNFQQSRSRGLDLMLSLAGDSAGLVTPAFDAVIRNRALVFDEMTSRRNESRASPDVIRLQAQLNAARRRLATLIARSTGGDETPGLRRMLEAAQRDGDAAERELAAGSAEYRTAQAHARAGLEEVRAAMPPDAALVAFVRFDRYLGEGTNAGSSPLRRPSYAVFVLRSDGQLAMTVLGAAQEIDGLVAQWRRDIAFEAAAANSENGSGLRSSGALLRRRIWDPLFPAGDTPRRILIVPDGAIGLVPFAALPVGTHSFLIEREATLHYLTAERDVTQPTATAVAGRGLLAIGGAAFGPPPAGTGAPSDSSDSRSWSGSDDLEARACAGASTLAFEPLAGSRLEVQQVARVWATVNRSSDDVRVLSGVEAREELFARYAPGARVLHLATHGFFLEAGCAERIPGTRAVGGLAVARPGRPARVWRRPLGVSALALAGANSRSKTAPNDSDGILLAEEVAAMRLTGVEWAVLSACDTGIGALVAGEGVLGLRRAFQLAGVRTVIMTLWPVDDRSTIELMRQLYTSRFVDGLPSDEALRAASLAVLRSRRAAGQSTHPFYWAAFIAAGDWR
jgi:CHAT domain-containing protein/tetratricopeptide (TPR) repeat protein